MFVYASISIMCSLFYQYPAEMIEILDSRQAIRLHRDLACHMTHAELCGHILCLDFTFSDCTKIGI